MSLTAPVSMSAPVESFSDDDDVVPPTQPRNNQDEAASDGGADDDGGGGVGATSSGAGPHTSADAASVGTDDGDEQPGGVNADSSSGGGASGGSISYQLYEQGLGMRLDKHPAHGSVVGMCSAVHKALDVREGLVVASVDGEPMLRKEPVEVYKAIATRSSRPLKIVFHDVGLSAGTGDFGGAARGGGAAAASGTRSGAGASSSADTPSGKGGLVRVASRRLVSSRWVRDKAEDLCPCMTPERAAMLACTCIQLGLMTWGIIWCVIYDQGTAQPKWMHLQMCCAQVDSTLGGCRRYYSAPLGDCPRFIDGNATQTSSPAEVAVSYTIPVDDWFEYSSYTVAIICPWDYDQVSACEATVDVRSGATMLASATVSANEDSQETWGQQDMLMGHLTGLPERPAPDPFDPVHSCGMSVGMQFTYFKYTWQSLADGDGVWAEGEEATAGQPLVMTVTHVNVADPMNALELTGHGAPAKPVYIWLTTPGLPGRFIAGLVLAIVCGILFVLFGIGIFIVDDD